MHALQHSLTLLFRPIPAKPKRNAAGLPAVKRPPLPPGTVISYSGERAGLRGQRL